MTAAVRAKAAEVLYPRLDLRESPWLANSVQVGRVAAALAAARADERQRWTAAVEGLAAEMSEASRLPISSEFDRGVAAHQRDAAARLRGLTTSSEEQQ